MAIAFSAFRGSATDTSGNVTPAITPTGNISAGRLVVVIGVLNGSVTTADVVDTNGDNTWELVGNSNNGNLRVWVWATIAQSTISTGDTVTVQWGGSSGGRGSAALLEFTIGTSVFYQDGAAAPNTGSSTSPTVTKSDMTGNSKLILGVAAIAGPNGDTYTQDSDYSNNTSFGTTGGTANLEASGRFGTRISSLASDTYNPTLGTSRAWVDLMVALSETNPVNAGSGAVTLPAITAAGTGSETIAGSGSATLGAITADGSGIHATGPTGSGAITLPAITASGSGSLAITGTGAPSFGAITATGTGTHVDTRLTVVELDLDGDGVFETDITSYVLSVESLTGRDRASQLTGKAGPGKLTLVVNNNDDRFSDFNSDSPYFGQLVPGARIRWRDANALTDDPVLLVQDRFNRSAGAIGDTENSLTWDDSASALDHFTVANSRAIPSSEGDANLSTVAISEDSYYVQTTVSQLGSADNLVGICYRWVSDNDYSLLVVDVGQESLKLIDVVTGTPSVVEELGTEIYSGITIGVLVDGTDETVYLEGVPFIGPVSTSHTSANEVGIYAEWDTGADRPDVDDFFAWDHLPVEVDGIFWTGRLTEPRPSVQAGPWKTATLEAVGPLAELARQAVTPPTSLQGKRTGLLMGNVLALSGHLRPPGPIAMGDITTGIFVTERWSYAINIARLVEETELGFLFETQEGFIGFRSRSHNDSVIQSDVTFRD